MAIKYEFLNCLKHYNSNETENVRLWAEIEKQYCGAGRHYHTLEHLDTLTKELQPLKQQFRNWDSVVFAIAYHDAIYNTLKNNNEERSAELAKKRLLKSNVTENVVLTCAKFILATKRHESVDRETDLFTDADLSILGSGSGRYLQYAAQIRSEYKLYPDLVYNPGRKKVLNHFLGMQRIFKTQEFADRFELAARANLELELITFSS